MVLHRFDRCQLALTGNLQEVTGGLSQDCGYRALSCGVERHWMQWISRAQYAQVGLRVAMIESLPGAILFSGVLPTHSLAVDDTKLYDLYIPSKFLLA